MKLKALISILILFCTVNWSNADEGNKDISKLVNDYFKIHGYDFSPEEEDFEDEDW